MIVSIRLRLDGGFGSYLFGMRDRISVQSADHGDTKNPGLLWIIGLCLLLAFWGCSCLPGRKESLQKELEFVKGLWKNKQDLKVEDAGIAALFALECYAWFCVGEIAGRGFTFTGYYV